MDDRLRDEITETILFHAAREAYEQEIAELMADDSLAFTPSEAHNARMRALFRRDERKEMPRKIYAVLKRVAVVTLIIAAVLSAVLLTDADVMAAVRGTIIRWHSQFNEFRFQGGDYETGDTVWFPDFLPAGFEMTELFEFSIGRHIFLEHPDGYYIMFQYRPANGFTGVDNEYTELSLIIIEGIEYFVITPLPDSEHYHQILWSMDGYVFTLISALNSEILLEIALSVSPQN